MQTQIFEYLQKEIRYRCEQPSNKFGMGCYYHIKAVVKNGEILADRYNADKEVVIISAWLHDVASITDHSLYEMHHIHGAEMAREILEKLNYDPSKIPLVEECIKNHRGSVKNQKQTVEEICVADADAISHFDSVPSLLYLAYKIRGMDIEEGREFVRGKLQRSFDKLSPESREFYGDKYRSVMSILE